MISQLLFGSSNYTHRDLKKLGYIWNFQTLPKSWIVLKIGTEESLEKVRPMVEERMKSTSLSQMGRMGILYSLMLAKNGELRLAFEVASQCRLGTHRLNLMIYLLARMGRRKEALKMLEETVKVGRKIRISIQNSIYFLSRVKLPITGLEELSVLEFQTCEGPSTHGEEFTDQ